MPPLLKEPLVSVIIVNWNYGRYIGQAIQSVKSQTYENIECVIVDNASTDDSYSIIENTVDGDARFRIIRNEENLGQLAAGLIGLDHTKGELVGFLDSDDYYFPEFVACHVQAQIGAEKQTAFSSSGVLTVDGSGKIVGGDATQNHTSDERFSPNLPKTPYYKMAAVDEDQYAALRAVTRFSGSKLKYWFWRPGSSNVIRRHILELLRPSHGTTVPFGGIDAYFLLAAHGLTGTTVLGLPLSAYRLHGDNDYLSTPLLHGMSNGNGGAHLRNTLVKKIAILHVAKKADAIIALCQKHFFNVLHLITRRHNAVDSPLLKYPHVFADTQLQHALASQLGTMFRAFGVFVTIGGLVWCMGPFYLVKVLLLGLLKSAGRSTGLSPH